jgi:transposase
VPGATPHYPPEFKAEAVRLVRSSGRSIPQIAKELGVFRQLFEKLAQASRDRSGGAPRLNHRGA